jgi:hypothetical protein
LQLAASHPANRTREKRGLLEEIMVAEKRAFKGTFAARLPRGDGGIEEERGEGKTQDSNLRTLERRAKHKCKSISKK